MNARVQTAVQAMVAAPKHDKEIEKEKMTLASASSASATEESKLIQSRKCLNRCQSRRERKIALQQDVDKLKKKLKNEENVHRALERAFTRPLGALPRLPPYLPSYTLELLAEVAVLEEEVVRLEEQVVNFRQGLYLEAIYISSSKKTMEHGLDSCSDRFSSQNVKNLEQQKSNSNNLSSPNRFTHGKRLPMKLISALVEEHRGKKNHSNGSLIGKELDEATGPNKLSEEILRCLLRIFSSIRLPNNTMVVDNQISSSVSGSSQYLDEGLLDPYGISSEFGRRDIGPYKHLHEIGSSLIDMNMIENSSFLTRKLRSLLKKLASVDLSELTHQQKLAFWINVYNSCMMNAFLENGIPTTPHMIVELMAKAMVNIGGHLLNAMTIEHFILRLPCNSNQISSKKFKSNEMATRAMFRLDWPEPLVTFALSCGSWSSPSVRVYTAAQVEKQLEEAMRDYLRAAIGISKPNRLAIPKLLDWYLLDFAKDMESLVDWICMQLPSELRSDASECLEIARRGVVPSPIQVLPYQFRFRYLL